MQTSNETEKLSTPSRMGSPSRRDPPIRSIPRGPYSDQQMTSEDLKKREELERAWEAEDVQRAAIRKQMGWSYARMDRHERLCWVGLTGQGGWASCGLISAIWVITVTAVYLTKSEEPANLGHWFTYLILSIIGCFPLTVVLFTFTIMLPNLRCDINERILKLVV